MAKQVAKKMAQTMDDFDITYGVPKQKPVETPRRAADDFSVGMRRPSLFDDEPEKDGAKPGDQGEPKADKTEPKDVSPQEDGVKPEDTDVPEEEKPGAEDKKEEEIKTGDDSDPDTSEKEEIKTETPPPVEAGKPGEEKPLTPEQEKQIAAIDEKLEKDKAACNKKLEELNNSKKELAEPAAPDAPNIFKRLLHYINPKWFKQEFEAYEQKREAWRKEMVTYDKEMKKLDKVIEEAEQSLKELDLQRNKQVEQIKKAGPLKTQDEQVKEAEQSIKPLETGPGIDPRLAELGIAGELLDMVLDAQAEKDKSPEAQEKIDKMKLKDSPERKSAVEKLMEGEAFKKMMEKMSPEQKNKLSQTKDPTEREALYKSYLQEQKTVDAKAKEGPNVADDPAKQKQMEEKQVQQKSADPAERKQAETIKARESMIQRQSNRAQQIDEMGIKATALDPEKMTGKDYEAYGRMGQFMHSSQDDLAQAAKDMKANPATTEAGKLARTQAENATAGIIYSQCVRTLYNQSVKAGKPIDVNEMLSPQKVQENLAKIKESPDFQSLMSMSPEKLERFAHDTAADTKLFGAMEQQRAHRLEMQKQAEKQTPVVTDPQAANPQPTAPTI